MSLIITPETKIGELLEAYPEIEETIASSAPAFAKLQNPVLRRTVMKSATLEQAAAMSGAPVRDLVAKVRQAAGVNSAQEQEGEAPQGDAPDWVLRGRVTHSIDADAMLATGVHPVGEVRQVAATLGKGEILRLTSSFRPAPLIDMMRRNGMSVDCRETPPGRFTTDFCRLP